MKKISAGEARLSLNSLANPLKAKLLSGYFKTGKGEYGEGDHFLGITVPEQRKIAKKFASLPLSEIEMLLESKIHEHRFVALEILVIRYESAVKNADKKTQKSIVAFYLSHADCANNWDLVDTSAPYILGEYLAEENLPIRKKLALLAKLAGSKSLWKRRIAIVSTYALIKRGYLFDTFALSELLMDDKHDLIHKACGWMLREAGKKDEKALRNFLNAHAAKMPRTMLRYSIERFSPAERRLYLAA